MLVTTTQCFPSFSQKEGNWSQGGRPVVLQSPTFQQKQEQLDRDVLTVFYPPLGGGDRATQPPSNKRRPH